MKALQDFTQPAYVDQLVASFLESFPPAMRIGSKRYIVTRPNYEESLGGGNLFRTSIHIAKENKPLEAKGDVATLPADWKEDDGFIDRIVHISNILQKEEGTDEKTTVVVFETNTRAESAYSSSVTRYYVSAERLAQKAEQKAIMVGYRNITNLTAEINAFLIDAKIPA